MIKMAEPKSKEEIKSKSTMEALGAQTADMAGHVLLGRVLQSIIAGLSFIVVARLLGQSEYGIYILATSVAGILISIGALGVASSFSKLVAEYKTKNDMLEVGRILSSGFIVITLVGVALSLITIALSGIIAFFVFGSSSMALLISIASVLIISNQLFTISYFSLIGFGRKKQLVIITLFQVIVQSAISISLAFAHFGAYAPIAGVAIGSFAGTFVTLLYIRIKERVPLALPSKESMRKLLNFSLPIGFSSTALGLVSSAGNIILGILSTFGTVGDVGVAQRTGSIITLATDSVGYSLLPLFASAQHVGLDSKHIGKLFDYSLYVMFILFVPLALFIALFSKQLSYIVFGAGYPTAYKYLVVVSFGFLLSIVSDYTMALLIGRDKVRQVMKYGTIAAVVELVLLLALVPLIKGYGLVLTASIITPFITMILYYRTAAKELGVHINAKRIARVTASGLICIAAAVPLLLVVSSGSLVWDIAMVAIAAAEQIILYPIVMVAIRGIGGDDVEIIKRISSGIPILGIAISIIAKYTDSIINLFSVSKQ